MTDEATPFTTGDRAKLDRLSIAVFGLDDGESGLLHEMRELNAKLGHLYLSVMAAAISFSFGSIGVVVAVITGGGTH